MKRARIWQICQVIFYFFFGIAILILVSLIIKTLPSQAQNFSSSTTLNTSYPAPITTLQPLLSSDSCDEAYSIRKNPNLNPTVSTQLERNYLICKKAKESTPDPSKDPTPAIYYGNSELRMIPFVHRPAGDGEILETGVSPFSSDYYVVNQWVVEQKGIRTIVFAGALQNDVANGGRGLDSVKRIPLIFRLGDG